MHASDKESYQSRFRRVLEYIDAHLDDELTVDHLSSVAAFSKYHFHRQFSALFGLSFFKYVQLSRLKRASSALAYRSELSITDIALNSHYEGPEAFARAFKKVFGQTPSEFRRNPQWTAWGEIMEPLGAIKIAHLKPSITLDQVAVVDFPETKMALLPHRGDPRLLGDSIRQLIKWRRQSDIPARATTVFDLIYDDRSLDNAEDFRMDLCLATDRDVTPNALGVVGYVIPAGSCATLRQVGPSHFLGAAVNFLYAEWLPHSGAELRDFPMFLRRVKLFPDVAENECVTDIFLPLTATTSTTTSI